MKKLEQSVSKKSTQIKREREENPVKDEEKEGTSEKRLKLSSSPKAGDDSAEAKTSDSNDSKSKEVVAKAENVKCELGEDDEPQELKEEMEESEEDGSEEEEPVEEDEDENEAGSDGNQKEELSEDEKMGDDLPDSATAKASTQERAVEKQGHVDEKQEAVIKEESSKQPVTDKELLEAFRFYDREWVGYIKVDDMRTIIHNLGKFYSKRAVKELLRIAVQESNKDHDGRIYYMKLLRVNL
ncbi:hypothetical protein MRB53_008369 [Persea americana]|uniref:Uncharacterized protein n=1 Tax=Persea americana TaxID=3435 RepID=A0ACC2MLW2_PERAE|nr:hypothetical protein MRB53_008369 [Persea americana]